MKRSLIALTVLLVPTLALAATMQTGENVTLSAPVAGDFYAAGNAITVGKDVKGDVIVAGSTVAVTSPVAEDLMAAGSTVQIGAPVGDDVRAAGSTVTLTNTVAGDVIVAGSTVTLTGDFAAKGDVWVYGSTVTVNGTIGGALHAYGNTIVINGDVTGPMDVRGDTVTINAAVTGPATLVGDTLTVGSASTFAAGLKYWRPEGATDLGVAGAVFDPTLAHQPRKPTIAATNMFSGVFNVFWIIATAIVLALFVGIARQYFANASKQLEKSFGWDLLYGLLYLILTPVVCLLLFVTVFGIPLALLTLILYFCSLFFLPAATSVTLALWLERFYKQHWNTWLLTLVSLGVYVGLRALAAIPVIGWATKAALLIAVAGALVTTKWEHMQKSR